MRFADGAVLLPRPHTRSSSSLSSSTSASTSRTASSGNLRSDGLAQGQQPIRRTSHTASRSVSSLVSAGEVAAGEGDDARSGSRTSATGSRGGSSTSGSVRGSESRRDSLSEGSRGDEREANEKDSGVHARDRTVQGGTFTTKGKETAQVGPEERDKAAVSKPLLHPSLPAKPVWVTTQPPLERPTGGGDRTVSYGSDRGDGRTESRRVFSSSSTASSSSSPAPPFVRASSARPQQVPYGQLASLDPQSSSAGYYDAAQATLPLAPPPPPSSALQPLPSHYPTQAYATSLPTTITQQTFYPPHLVSPQPPAQQAWWDPSNPPPDAYYGQQQLPYVQHAQQPPYPDPAMAYQMQLQMAVAEQEQEHDRMLMGPEMRRPPPRSTELFDPNRPSGTSGIGMRRVGSGSGTSRRADASAPSQEMEGLTL